MGTATKTVLEPADLNDTDREILKMLRSGRVTPPMVAKELEISREYASERLIRLKEHEHAERPAPGLYELVDDPIGEMSKEPVGMEQRVEELQAELEDCREELASQTVAVSQDTIDGLEAALTALDGQHPDSDMAESELRRVLEDLR